MVLTIFFEQTLIFDLQVLQNSIARITKPTVCCLHEARLFPLAVSVNTLHPLGATANCFIWTKLAHGQSLSTVQRGQDVNVCTRRTSGQLPPHIKTVRKGHVKTES